MKNLFLFVSLNKLQLTLLLMHVATLIVSVAMSIESGKMHFGRFAVSKERKRVLCVCVIDNNPICRVNLYWFLFCHKLQMQI